MSSKLELLRAELHLMLDNIDRVNVYINDPENAKYRPNNCLVVGELKHRAVALKQRLTIINKSCTQDFFKKL